MGRDRVMDQLDNLTTAVTDQLSRLGKQIVDLQAKVTQLDNLITTGASQFSGLETRVGTLERPEVEKRPHSHTLRHYIATGIIAVATLLVSGLAIYATWTTFRLSEDIREKERERGEQIKSLEIADHFIDRFYQIEKEKDTKQLDFYYDRLYGLHSEEFTHYKKGLLDKDIYLSWLRFRYRAYHYDPTKQTEQRQWKRVKEKHLIHQEFIDFMDKVLGVSPQDRIKAILDEITVTRIP